MPLTPFRSCLPLIAVLSFAVVACAEVASPAPTRVEVWRGGDDGLTLRLADTVVKAFKGSSDFTLSTGKHPGTLIVLIPTHVRWERLGWRPFRRRTQVFYTVEFKTIDQSKELVGSIQPLSTTEGSCRDDRMTDYAAEIMKAARVVISRLR